MIGEELDLELESLANEFESDINGDGILDEDLSILNEMSNQAMMLKKEEE